MNRYERQTCLPEVGEEGQARLAASRVLVVGAGGLGSPVILYLAGAGIGRVDVYDHDKVEDTNLHRQVLYTDKHVGRLKAHEAAERVKAVGCKSNWESEKFQDILRVIKDYRVLKNYDIILDCTDRWSSHDAVTQECRLAGKTVVHGSIQGLLGRVIVFDPGGPCWRCLHPTQPDNSGAVRGTLGPVCGVIGSLMALEALRLLLGWESNAGKMLVYDAKAAQTRTFKMTPRPDCPCHE